MILFIYLFYYLYFRPKNNYFLHTLKGVGRGRGTVREGVGRDGGWDKCACGSACNMYERLTKYIKNLKKL